MIQPFNNLHAYSLDYSLCKCSKYQRFLCKEVRILCDTGGLAITSIVSQPMQISMKARANLTWATVHMYVSRPSLAPTMHCIHLVDIRAYVLDYMAVQEQYCM